MSEQTVPTQNETREPFNTVFTELGSAWLEASGSITIKFKDGRKLYLFANKAKPGTELHAKAPQYRLFERVQNEQTTGGNNDPLPF